MRRSSWPVLVALAAAFLLAFWVQRGRSTFLAIERDREAAVAIAARHGIAVAEAMALRDLVGLDADATRWQTAAATFASERPRLGDAFAAVVAVGDAAAALAAVGPTVDAAAAWQQFRVLPAALPGLRFLAMRERFASRAAGRD